MGCATSRDRLSPEEHILTSFENELHYGAQTSTQIDLVFRKYSLHGGLNPAQLRNAASKLNIRIDNYANHNQIKPFYDSLKQEELIPLRTLLLLGIFLGQGSPSEKAKLLFEVYDELLLEEITGSKVVHIIHHLFSLAVVHLPNLIAPTTNSLDVNAVKQYLAKIEHVKDKATETLAKAITGDANKVTKAKFILALSTESIQSVLSQSGFRSYFYKHFHEAPVEIKSAFEKEWVLAHPPPPQAKAEATVTAQSGSKTVEFDISIKKS